MAPKKFSDRHIQKSHNGKDYHPLGVDNQVQLWTLNNSFVLDLSLVTIHVGDMLLEISIYITYIKLTTLARNETTLAKCGVANIRRKKRYA